MRKRLQALNELSEALSEIVYGLDEDMTYLR